MQKNNAGFIKYIVIIAVIMAAVFLSQQSYFGKSFGKSGQENILSQGLATVQSYAAKGSNWVSDKVFPSIGGEVQKRGDIIKEGVSKEKEKVSESVGEKIKNYFSGVVDSITGKKADTTK